MIELIDSQLFSQVFGGACYCSCGGYTLTNLGAVTWYPKGWVDSAWDCHAGRCGGYALYDCQNAAGHRETIGNTGCRIL